MSFNEIRTRIFKRWWLVLASTFIFTLVFYPWANSSSYQSSIGVGIGFNNTSFINTGNTNTSSYNNNNQNTNSSESLAYVEMTTEFTQYLEGRFKSVEVQDTIASVSGLRQKTYNEKIPFYNVNAAGAGFVTISYNGSSSAEQANNFLAGVKTAYSKLVSEWNESRLSKYQVVEMKKFNEVVVESERPIQFQILPVIIGWIFGIVLAALLPERKKLS